MRQAIRRRLRGDVQRVKSLLQRAFAEDRTKQEVAGSFGVGVFVTMLPTLGLGFLLFVVLAFFFERLSKLALIASAVVFNPVVKWGVYGLSFGLGVLLLGPVDGATTVEVSLTAAPEVLIRLLVGNVILAVVAAVPSYYLALRFVERYGDSALDVVDEFGDEVEEWIEPIEPGNEDATGNAEA